MSDQLRLKFVRLLRIIERLQAGPRYNVRDLAEELQVNRRTIFRDIRFLREIGFFISVDEGTKNYYCRGGGVSIAIPRFNHDELETLLIAAETSPVKQTLFFAKSLSNATSRLLNKLNVAQKTRINRLMHLHRLQLGETDGSPDESLFRIIQQAANDDRTVRVKYRHDANTHSDVFLPQLIVFYENEWLIEGISQRSGKTTRVKMLDIIACDGWDSKSSKTSDEQI